MMKISIRLRTIPQVTLHEELAEQSTIFDGSRCNSPLNQLTRLCKAASSPFVMLLSASTIPCICHHLQFAHEASHRNGGRRPITQVARQKHRSRGRIG